MALFDAIIFSMDSRMHHESPPIKRLLPWYSVTYEHLNGGDFEETPARNEADAASIIFCRRMCPGFRVTAVEFATWHPSNRAMMGLWAPKEQAA